MLFSEGNGPKIFSLLQDSFLCLPNSTLMPKLIAISTAIFFLFPFFFLIDHFTLCILKRGSRSTLHMKDGKHLPSEWSCLMPDSNYNFSCCQRNLKGE